MKRSHLNYRRSLLLMVAASWLCSSFVGRAAVLLSENFDGVVAPAIPAGWTATVINTNNFSPWQTSANFADTLPNAVFAADHTNVSDNVLISPSVLITTTNAQLTFRHKYDLESDGATYYDGGILEVSTNGGPFNNITSIGGSFLTNGYLGAIESSTGNPLGGQGGWSGNSGGFITTIAKLPASANGNQVRLRWRCGTDNTLGRTGWYVDSISLTDGIAGPTITDVSRNGNNINFSFATEAGQNYTVEYKNSLSVSNWTFLQSVFGDGTTKLISDSLLASPQRFYRVKNP